MTTQSKIDMLPPVRCTARQTLTSLVIAVALLSGAARGSAQQYTISTVAGNGSGTYSGDGGPATSAGIYSPSSIALDAAGNLYIADSVSRIRKVSANGIITTVAGGGTCGSMYCGDGGPATSAMLNGPQGVAVDASGNLYIADTDNEVVRKVSANGTITTIAGGGSSLSDGVPAADAELESPWNVALDAAGNLYIVDLGDNRVRKLDTSGTITTVAGSLNPAGLGNGGPATNASLNMPTAIAFDSGGNMYIADSGNNAIRKVSTAGTISTAVGGTFFGLGLFSPSGVAVDPSGNLFISDTGNQRVLELPAGKNVVLIAGNGSENYSGDGGPATEASLDMPEGLAIGLAGGIYLADTGNGRVRLLTLASTTQAPAITGVANAEGGDTTIAANSWVAISGTALAPPGDTRTWGSADFVNGQMPTQLDGVSVTMNGENAYVYYISPTQINVLTPPDLAIGVVQVKVTAGGVTSAQFTSLGAKGSPSFFIFGAGPYVAAAHANGSLVGPATLYPGLSTPASPGETIILYANGFGAVTPPVTAGSEMQSGTLPVLPLVEIGANGGVAASVQFAGLVSPGLYQFNIVVPPSTPAGDNPLLALLPGVLAGTTQSGVMLTVQ